VVRNERPGRGPARNGLHHRRLDFDVAARVEKPSQFANDVGAPDKNYAGSFIGDQIEIPLPVPYFDIRESMPFFRQGQEGFAEEGRFGDPHGELARLRPEQVPRDTDQIPKIE
jgi:hypothetical protein